MNLGVVMFGGDPNAISAAMSAVAAIAALAVAFMGLLQSRRQSQASKRQTARAIDDALQSRLDPMYEGLRKTLGHLEDGVPHEIRHVLIPFFVLYSDAFGAHRDGLTDERDWQGLSQELAYWAQKPIARQAWVSFRQQSWTLGFEAHVDSVLAGPPAYPNLQEVVRTPSVDEWLSGIPMGLLRRDPSG